MSLKAKIEAVIYASEDPVTLAQLIGLLGHEAQLELDRERSAQSSFDLGDEEEPASFADPGSVALAEPQPSTEPAPESRAEESSPKPEAPPASPPESPETAPIADSDANEPDPYATAQISAQIENEEGAAAPALASLNAQSGSPAAPTEALSASEPGVEPSPSQAAAAAPPPPNPKQQERALREYFRARLDELIRDYANGDRGLEIREVANGFRLATKPEYHDAVRGFVKSLKPPLKLTLQALETLAVVAYKQPITAPEISEIRGVDSGGVLGSLMARKLIVTAGRKQVIGRPILYKTTRDFLLRFGLKDVQELPSIEEFEKMAGELADEPLQEEIPMSPEANASSAKQILEHQDLEPEKDEHEPQADGDPSDPVPGASTDGRNSSVPPNYEAPPETDTSAQEAEIQSNS